MFSATQAALFGVLSAHFVTAFSPIFTSPRQCETLRITWSSLDLPVVDMPMGEIFMSLIPLDNDPSRIAPAPYTLSVPPGGHDITALPFPAGTQFFASAHFPGSMGLERRVVSKVFTVEHSPNVDCLPTKSNNKDGHGRVKSFGKRQVSVIGPSTVDSTGVPPPVNAIASPSSSGAAPAISVIGVNVIPAGGSSVAAPTTTTSSSPAPGASDTGSAVPPVRVIGTSQHPATGLPPPANVAPAPSASGSVPPVQVIGTSFVSATGGAPPEASSANSSSGASSTASYAESSSTSTSTSYTGTATEMPMATEWTTVTVTRHHHNSIVHEEPCDSSEHSSMHGTMMPPSTITITSLPAATQTAANTEVVHYTAFSDMVNAANSIFKAWNPYKAAYTPSAGN